MESNFQTDAKTFLSSNQTNFSFLCAERCLDPSHVHFLHVNRIISKYVRINFQISVSFLEARQSELKYNCIFRFWTFIINDSCRNQFPFALIPCIWLLLHKSRVTSSDHEDLTSGNYTTPYWMIACYPSSSSIRAPRTSAPQFQILFKCWQIAVKLSHLNQTLQSSGSPSLLWPQLPTFPQETSFTAPGGVITHRIHRHWGFTAS